MKEKMGQLEILRDLSIQKPPVWFLFRNVDHHLLKLDVFTGAATVGKRFAILPLVGIEDETIPLDE